MRQMRTSAADCSGLCWSAIVIAVVLLQAMLISGPTQAQASELEILSKTAKYDDVRFELQNAIIARGLTIDYNGQVGKMLERTGADVGSARKLYNQAEYFSFCSAKLSRAMMEADANNIGFCPYVVFIFETAAEPGVIKVGYRKISDEQASTSKSARAAINDLLRVIVKGALQ